MVSDRYNAVFFTFVLHGIVILLPWNMFTTAKSYFMDYKLSSGTEDAQIQEYRNNFLSYLGLASQIPNLLITIINLLVPMGSNGYGFRIIGGIAVGIGVFLFTICLAILDTNNWVKGFFYFTMISVVILNISGGIYQNTLYGLAANFPMKYSNGVVLGTSVCGTLTAILNLVSIAISPDYKVAAIYYFVTALLFMVAGIASYKMLDMSAYYKHHLNITKVISESDHADIELNRSAKPKTTLKKVILEHYSVFKQVWPECMNAFMVFFVTLAVYPAVTANVERVDSEFPLSDTYFIPVLCFFFFNFFCLIGNILSQSFQWPKPNYLWILVFLRILLIPLLMFSNYKPSLRSLPVLLGNDYMYALLSIILGLSNGYCSSLAIMYAPTKVAPELAPKAGMMAAFSMVLGLFIGINFSFFVSWMA